MDTGYIRLYRKMMDWEWYTDIPTFRLFTHLLLKVNHKDVKWQGQVIERGSCITSYSKLALETGLTVQQVRTAIKHLISTNELTKYGTSKYTIIKVLNYDSYQCANKVDNKQLTNNQQTANKQLTTNNNEKNDNNEINIKEENKQRRKEIDYQLIVDMYNDTCVSFPRLQKLSENRKKAIKARLNTYTVEDLKRAFELAESSSFLKGQNNRNWSATFDWMMKDTNLAKILEGNYNNKQQSIQYSAYQQKGLPEWYHDQSILEQSNQEEHFDSEELERLKMCLAGQESNEK